MDIGNPQQELVCAKEDGSTSRLPLRLQYHLKVRVFNPRTILNAHSCEQLQNVVTAGPRASQHGHSRLRPSSCGSPCHLTKAHCVTLRAVMMTFHLLGFWVLAVSDGLREAIFLRSCLRLLLWSSWRLVHCQVYPISPYMIGPAG